MLPQLSNARSATAALVLLAQLVSFSAPAVPIAASAEGAKSSIDRGREYYDESRFDDAIGLLRDLVDKNALGTDDLQRAREILARSYVKKGYPGAAKDLFRAMLNDDPNYRPDPIKVPPDETAVFDRALSEFRAAHGAPTTQAGQDSSSGQAPPPAERKLAPDASQSIRSSEREHHSATLWYVIGGVAVGVIAYLAFHKNKKPVPVYTAPLAFPPPPTP